MLEVGRDEFHGVADANRKVCVVFEDESGGDAGSDYLFPNFGMGTPAAEFSGADNVGGWVVGIPGFGFFRDVEAGDLEEGVCESRR